LLSRPDARVLAVFGAGAQGRTQVEAACTVRRFDTVWIFDADQARAEALGRELSGAGPIPLGVRVAASPSEAVAHADVICTATTSAKPVFSDSDLRTGVHISAVGSYTPEMQEIPGETVSRARLFVDSRPAALAETGDLIQPIRAGLFSQDHISAELGELVLGSQAGRLSSDEVTMFKSVGVAVQDAVAASLALRNARLPRQEAILSGVAIKK
jgi:ornithine cyclodeaminase